MSETNFYISIRFYKKRKLRSNKVVKELKLEDFNDITGTINNKLEDLETKMVTPLRQSKSIPLNDNKNETFTTDNCNSFDKSKNLDLVNQIKMVIQNESRNLSKTIETKFEKACINITSNVIPNTVEKSLEKMVTKLENSIHELESYEETIEETIRNQIKFETEEIVDNAHCIAAAGITKIFIVHLYHSS